MVLFRVFGWTRRSTFAKSSLLSVLRSVAEKTGAFSSGKYNSVTAAAARYCIQVRTSAVSSPLGASVYTVSLGVGRTYSILHLTATAIGQCFWCSISLSDVDRANLLGELLLLWSGVLTFSSSRFSLDEVDSLVEQQGGWVDQLVGPRRALYAQLRKRHQLLRPCRALCPLHAYFRIDSARSHRQKTEGPASLIRPTPKKTPIA